MNASAADRIAMLGAVGHSGADFENTLHPESCRQNATIRNAEQFYVIYSRPLKASVNA